MKKQYEWCEGKKAIIKTDDGEFCTIECALKAQVASIEEDSKMKNHICNFSKKVSVKFTLDVCPVCHKADPDGKKALKETFDNFIRIVEEGIEDENKKA